MTWAVLLSRADRRRKPLTATPLQQPPVQMRTRRRHVAARRLSPSHDLTPLEPRVLMSATDCPTPDMMDGSTHGIGCGCAGCTGNGIQVSLNPLTDYEDDHVHDDDCGHDPDTGLPHGLPLPEEGIDPDFDNDGQLDEGPFDLANTFKLHSNAGADHTIYLDFDGHTTSGTYWNNGRGDFTTPKFSLDSDVDNFSNSELQRIQAIWERVAEDFRPFDVNVTTEAPDDVEDLIKSGSSDDKWGVRVVVGGSSYDWYGNGAGGVAYVGSFNWSTDTPTYVFEAQLGNGNEKYTAEAISHEAGHTLGLYHDGTSSVGYYSGHGSGATGWASIMGVGYYKELSQWSQGEYNDANNSQDDLAVITRTSNGFSYRADDFGDNTAGAFALNAGGETSIFAEGIIERNTDLDYFSFTTGDGLVNINVDPFHRAPNLDILATLYDSSGTIIATSNPGNALDASFSLSLSAGTYYLSVDGTGKGDPLGTGYTDYGSLGYYKVTGSVQASGNNAAPDAVNDAITVDEDSSGFVNALANDSDSDGDPLAVAGFTQGQHGTVTHNGNGGFTYTPDANYFGNDSFTYTISDGHGGADSATVSVTVNNVNDGPTANNDTLVLNEDTSKKVWVLTNDSDIDGDFVQVVSYTQPSHGQIEYDNDGGFTYTPDANFFGSDSFAYTISDGNGGTDTATVNITVNAVNDGPEASNDTLVTDEDNAKSITVLGNDSDIDGDSLSVVDYTQGQFGQVTLNGDGSFTYTPSANFFGSDSFTYTISDGNGGFDTATVSVTVNAVNDDPIANDDALEVDEDGTLNISAATLLGNDVDVDGDSLSIDPQLGPNHGQLLYNPDGSLTYIPDANFHGSDSFTYLVTDGTTTSNVATVNITVNAVNDGPAAADDSLGQTQGPMTITIASLLSNDSDIDGDSLSLVNFTQPTNGTLVDNGDGTLTYTPADGYTGNDSFTYTIGDGNGGEATATANLTVIATSSSAFFAEVGRVDGLNHVAQTITLTRTFVDPVVIANFLTHNGGDSSIIHVSDVQGDRFTVQLIEGPTYDGNHTTESVSFIVAERGRWELADGRIMEVGTVDTGATVNNTITNSWETVSFAQGFADEVVVLSQVQGAAGSSDFISTRHQNTTTNGFQLGMELAEGVTAQAGVRTVGFIAIEAGVGQTEDQAGGGVTLEAGITNDSVTHSYYSQGFAGGFTEGPNIMANIRGYDGADSSHLRLGNLDANGFTVMVEEDKNKDSEQNHTTESVNYLAIGGSGLLKATNADGGGGDNGDGGVSDFMQDVNLDFDTVNGNVTPDTSPNGNNHGNLNGNATIVNDSERGNVLSVDGTSTATIADADDINLGTHSQRTIAFWFKADAQLGRTVLYEEGGTVRGINAYLDGGKLYVGGWNSPSGESGWTGTWLSVDFTPDGQWHHVAITLDGGGSVTADAFKAYLDGAMFGSGAGSQLWAHSDDTGIGGVAGNTLFHDGSNAGGNTLGLAGLMDDFKLYNRTLTADEIMQLAAM